MCSFLAADGRSNLLTRCSLRGYALKEYSHFYKGFFGERPASSQRDSASSMKVDVELITSLFRDSGFFRKTNESTLRHPSTVSLFAATAAMTQKRFTGRGIEELLNEKVWGYGTEASGYQPVATYDLFLHDPNSLRRGDILIGVWLFDDEHVSRITTPPKKKNKTKKTELKGVELTPLCTAHPIHPEMNFLDIEVNNNGWINGTLVALSKTNYTDVYPVDVACIESTVGLHVVLGIGDSDWDYTNESTGPTWKRNKHATGLIDFPSMCRAIKDELQRVEQSHIRLKVFPLMNFSLKHVLLKSGVDACRLNTATTLVLCTHRLGTPVKRAPVREESTEITEETKDPEQDIFGSLASLQNDELLAFMTKATSDSGNKAVKDVHVDINETNATPAAAWPSLTESEVTMRVNAGRERLVPSRPVTTYLQKHKQLHPKIKLALEICAGKKEITIRDTIDQGINEQRTSSRGNIQSMDTDTIPNWLKEITSVTGCMNKIRELVAEIQNKKKELNRMCKQRQNLNKQKMQTQDHIFQAHYHASRKQAQGDSTIVHGATMEQSDINKKLEALVHDIRACDADIQEKESMHALISKHLLTVMSNSDVSH